MAEFLFFLVMFLLAMTLGLISVLLAAIASVRRGSLLNKPRRVKSFIAQGRPVAVLKRITGYALTGAYHVEVLDETAGQLVLSDSSSSTEGFFYPIFVTAQGNNKTLVEVGIKSKTFQGLIITWRSHERCFNELKAATFAAWT